MGSHASNPNDPFHAPGADHGKHGHHVVAKWQLVGVFVALLFLTLLTVGATWVEVWYAATFDVVIPAWINVLVALSIAVVKTVLVMMIFMGLLWDNPLNLMIMVFTVFCLAFFIGFTAIDLGNRQTLSRDKGLEINEGGMGLMGDGISVVEAAKLAAQGEHGGEYSGSYGGGGHGYGKSEPDHSTADYSRPVHGITLPSLGGAPAKKDDAHDDGH